MRRAAGVAPYKQAGRENAFRKVGLHTKAIGRIACWTGTGHWTGTEDIWAQFLYISCMTIGKTHLIYSALQFPIHNIGMMMFIYLTGVLKG